MREQVLKQAGSNGRAEVGVSVDAPLPCEAPYFFRVLLDIILNTEDRLPSWIRLAVGRHLSWENPLCFSYGLEYGHCFSQRIIYDSSLILGFTTGRALLIAF